MTQDETIDGRNNGLSQHELVLVLAIQDDSKLSYQLN